MPQPLPHTPEHAVPPVAARGDRSNAWWQAGLVAFLIALISGAHFATSIHHHGLHAIYEYAYYLPILAAAYWFGAPGGLLAAFFCAVLYVPHIRVTWADNPAYAASQYGELLAFHLIGGIVGWLIGRLRRSTEEAHHAAQDIARKNQELVESHQHLTRAERLSSLGTLAAGLAHEVRTPIAAIKGALDILASRAKAGTPEAEFTDVATKELSRLGALLEEFLAYARPRPPARTVVRIGELVQQVEALLRPEAHAREVRLVLSLAAVPEITADPAQLTQVLLNLVLNGLQASPRGGTVEVRIGQDRRDLVIEVVDQGPGMSADDATRVFEPFFTTKAKGTGLGLPIAQRIVSAHDGIIDLLPATPSGMRAVVRLPLTSSPVVERRA